MATGADHEFPHPGSGWWLATPPWTQRMGSARCVDPACFVLCGTYDTISTPLSPVTRLWNMRSSPLALQRSAKKFCRRAAAFVRLCCAVLRRLPTAPTACPTMPTRPCTSRVAAAKPALKTWTSSARHSAPTARPHSTHVDGRAVHCIPALALPSA